jgi:hypothetical protein
MPDRGFATEIEFYRFFVKTALPRARYVYFLGNGANHLLRMREKDTAIHQVASAAWDDRVSGEVHLFQRRLLSGEIEYIAQKASESWNG